MTTERVPRRAGPSTVCDVQERLPEAPGYTTMLKLLHIMHEKGLVTRDTSQRAHVYAAAVEETTTQRRLVAICALLGRLEQERSKYNDDDA